MRTATLSYDATALVAALVKTQAAAALFSRSADQSAPALPASTACSASAGRHQRARACGDAGDAVGRADRKSGAAIIRGLGTYLSREIGDHGIEHRKCRLRDAQMAACGDFDRAFRMQDRDALRGRAARPAISSKALRDRCLRQAAAPSADIRRRAPRVSAARRRSSRGPATRRASASFPAAFRSRSRGAGRFRH